MLFKRIRGEHRPNKGDAATAAMKATNPKTQIYHHNGKRMTNLYSSADEEEAYADQRDCSDDDDHAGRRDVNRNRRSSSRDGQTNGTRTVLRNQKHLFRSSESSTPWVLPKDSFEVRGGRFNYNNGMDPNNFVNPSPLLNDDNRENSADDESAQPTLRSLVRKHLANSNNLTRRSATKERSATPIHIPPTKPDRKPLCNNLRTIVPTAQNTNDHSNKINGFSNFGSNECDNEAIMDSSLHGEFLETIAEATTNQTGDGESDASSTGSGGDGGDQVEPTRRIRGKSPYRSGEFQNNPETTTTNSTMFSSHDGMDNDDNRKGAMDWMTCHSCTILCDTIKLYD